MGIAATVWITLSLQLPGKAEELERRHQRRCRAVAKAMKCSDEDVLLKAQVQVTDELVLVIQRMLYHRRLVFLVAPYEADAQLAYEIKQGRVYAILTEDSDLLVHTSTRVITEFDSRTGGLRV